MSTPAQPFTELPRLADALRTQGYALVRPQDVAALAGCTLDELNAMAPSWDRLEPDRHLRDGGHYRFRRHSCFIEDAGTLTLAPHRAHWQPVEYNALHGGMHRMFEPIEPGTAGQPAWGRLLRALGETFSILKGKQPWYVEAHQFRIDTAEGIGRPTPEGAHRDGVDYVAVILVDRHNIKGGETRVFEANGPDGKRFTMLEPWTMLVLDDEAVIHESTPIQPTGDNGHRDTLVLTWRVRAFLGEDA